MAKVYFVTGALGAGKTLCSVDMIRRYLDQGRRIATNVNLNLEFLCGSDNKHSRVTRIPDAPVIGDLRAIGLGSESADDKTHGLLVLDELGTWFNTRDFATKGRLAVIKWMIHMRKRRWDVVFIVQDFGMVDKQARGNIAQHLVTCSSSKDYWLFKLFPKFHTAIVRHTSSRMVVERWYYRARDVIDAYDTEQLFHTDQDDDSIIDSDAQMSEKEAECKALNGLYCLLPPAYFSSSEREEIKNRFDSINGFRKRVVFGFLAFIMCGTAYAFMPFSLSGADARVIEEGGDVPEIAAANVAELESVGIDPEIYRFRQFRVVRIVNIGGSRSFTITNGESSYRSNELEALGYGVRFRPRNEIVIVDKHHNFVNLFL